MYSNGEPRFTFHRPAPSRCSAAAGDRERFAYMCRIYFWQRLSAGGQEVQCGWLKDKFGISWQVVPTVLPEMLQDQDPEKAKRVMAAMLKMKKIDIGGLKKAYEGR